MSSSGSIVRKLAAWYVLSVFVAALGGFSYLSWSLSRIVDSQNQAILADRLQSIIGVLHRPQDPVPTLIRRVQVEWPNWKFERVFVQVRAADGRIVAQTPGLSSDYERRLFADLSPGAPPRLMEAESMPYLALAARSEAYTVFLALDVSQERALLNRYRLQVAATLLALLLLTALVGRWIARVAFRPIESFIQTATRISSSNLDERIQLGDLPEEIRHLGATVNEMLTRLEESFSRLSRFSSDLAHELRTPLSNLRVEFEVSLAKDRPVAEYRELSYSALEEIKRLSRIIEALLFLAAAEQPDKKLRRERFRLREEIVHLAEFHAAFASEQGTRIGLEIDGDLEMSAERVLFQRAVSNLLANAVRHAPGGAVTVHARRVNGGIEVEVGDDGEGISAPDQLRVFERFFRGDPSRKGGKYEGFGLGLTIVKTIVELHGGSVSLRSETGRGTAVTLKFPIDNDSQH